MLTNKPEDRRIRRTKRLLKQGLAELMMKKEFKNITVRDITDHMDLNRGTFYLHYTDTYDLLQKLESDTLSDVQKMIDEHSSEAEAGSLKPVFEPILSYIVANRDICYSLFVNNASSNFIDNMQKLICRNGLELIHKFSDRLPEEKLAYLFSFITFGLIGLIKQWFDTDMQLAEHEIVDMADCMVIATAESLIE